MDANDWMRYHQIVQRRDERRAWVRREVGFTDQPYGAKVRHRARRYAPSNTSKANHERYMASPESDRGS